MPASAEGSSRALSRTASAGGSVAPSDITPAGGARAPRAASMQQQSDTALLATQYSADSPPVQNAPVLSPDSLKRGLPQPKLVFGGYHAQ